MSLIFMDGADDGLSAFKWTTGGTRSTTVARTGPASLLVGGGTSGSTNPNRTFDAGDRHATMITGFAYYDNGIRSFELVNFVGVGGIVHVSVERTASAGFIVRRGTGGTLLASSASSLWTAANWYFFEIKVVIDDVVGVVQIKVNGATVVNFSGDTRNGGADALVYAMNYISDSGAPDRLINVDDLYILNGAGSVNNNFIGDCAVKTLYPNGNGNYSQGVNSASTSVNNYSYVNEPGIPNAANYVAFAATGDKDSYTFDDLPAGTVYGIAQRAYASKSDAGSRTMRNFQRIAATDYPSAVDQGLSVTPTYLGKSDLIQVSPATGVLWTVTEINGAEFGTEARA